MTAVLAVWGYGCLKADSGGITAQQEAEALAAALLSEVEFEGGTVIDGDLPETTADTLVITPVGQQVIVSPGATSIMAIEVDNDTETDDPITATLIHVKNAASHVEVPAMHKAPAAARDNTLDAGEAADGDTVVPARLRVENHFTAKAGICDNLCNKIFATDVDEVAKRRGGGIGRHHRRTLVLDCRERGNKARCTDDDGDDIPADALAEMMDTVGPTGNASRDGGAAFGDPKLSACAMDLVTKAGDVPEECAQCLCDGDAEAISACDDACWAFIGCITANCAENDIECISARCAGASIGVDQSVVMAIGAVTPQCAAMCPSFEGGGTGPLNDAGMENPVVCEDVAVPGATAECRTCLCRQDEQNASMCDDRCLALIECAAACQADQACVVASCGDLVAAVGDVTATNAVGALMAGVCAPSCAVAVDVDAGAAM